MFTTLTIKPQLLVNHGFFIRQIGKAHRSTTGFRNQFPGELRSASCFEILLNCWVLIVTLVRGITLSPTSFVHTQTDSDHMNDVPLTSVLQQHPFNGPLCPCPGLRGRAGIRKLKPMWILLKQETVGGSGISWAIC